MSKLYGSTSWRRVISLAVAVFMILSLLGTSGYAVFAEDLLDESTAPVAEEVVTAEPEEATPAEEETVEASVPTE